MIWLYECWREDRGLLGLLFVLLWRLVAECAHIWEAVLAIVGLAVQFGVCVLERVRTVVHEEAWVELFYWCGLYAILLRKPALVVKHGAVEAHLDPRGWTGVFAFGPAIASRRLGRGASVLVAFPLSLIRAIGRLSEHRQLLKDLFELRALLCRLKSTRIGAVYEVIPRCVQS